MSKKAQSQSVLVIIGIITIILIIVFIGLGEFLGTASDVMCSANISGFAGWFFCNWLLVIILTIFVWIMWMMYRG